jgi:hypothetical protein
VAYAISPIAAAGYTIIEPRPDYSHTNATVQSDTEATLLLGRGAAGEGRPRFRVGLRFERFALEFQEADGTVHATHPMAGHRLNNAYDWLAGRIAAYWETAESEFVRPGYRLPPHPIGEGEVFANPDPEERAEVARWYADAVLFLDALHARVPGVSAPACWLHHFDLAVLIPLDPGADPEASPSIGIGLAPADAAYGAPYWYVNRWPEVALPDEPPDGGGHWHSEGWTGAVLPAMRLAHGDAEAQAARLIAFTRSAVSALYETEGAV